MRVLSVFSIQSSQQTQRFIRFLRLLRRSRRPIHHYFPIVVLTVLLTCFLSSGRVAIPAAATEVQPQAELPNLKSAITTPSQWVESGRDRYRNAQFSAAIDLWQQALAAFRAQGDRLNQAMVLNNLALAYQQLGQWPAAEQAIATSLKLVPTIPGTATERLSVQAQALNNQGSLQLAQGQTEAALASWQQATQLYQQLGQEDAAVWSLLRQAQALRALGFYQRASQLLEQVAQSLPAQPNSALKVESLHSLGEMLQATGDLKQSAAKLQESLAIAKQLRPAADVPAILLSLGNTAWLAQQSEAALSYYQQAIAQSPNATAALPAQLNQLHLLIETAQWQPAAELWPQIQGAIASVPANRTHIYAQINFAQSLLKLRQHSTLPTVPAIASILARAVQQAREISDSQAESYGLGYLGYLYEQTQQFSEAQKLTEQALLLAQLNNAPNIAYRWQWQLGRLLQVQGDALPSSQPALASQQQVIYNQAIAAYTEAIATLSTLRGDLVATNLDMQFSFRESVEPVYRQLVSLLLLHPGQTAASQANLQQARQVIESLQVAELDNFFREACLNAQTQLADRVDPQAAVVYPIILPNRLEVILSLPNQPLRHYTSAIAQSDLETLIQQTRQSLSPISNFQTRLSLSQTLYDLLLRPAEADLMHNDIKTLAFVLDGSLRNIPMAILHDGQQYVIEKYSVALTPSLQLMQPKPLASQKLHVLMGGLSEARDQFSSLPGVEIEVKEIQAEVPSQVLFNQNFNTQNLSKEMTATAFPIVHLATHGQFSSAAEDTFVLVWDQRLSVRQLGALLQSRDDESRTPIELLVLSACQTAAGDNRATLGLAGLAVKSGARSTLATLWAVDDAATSAFMVQFYKEIARGGITKAEAVRQAQLFLLKQPALEHPYYWAPFVLVGNWL